MLPSSELAIRNSLRDQGIGFEGGELRFSLSPTIVAAAEISAVAQKGALIRATLQEIIRRFVEEHRADKRNAPLHRFFQPYHKWWDLIASEQRQTEPIQLMRYDAIREDAGSWRLIETNTCCPGGTIHCALLRDAWLSSPLGRVATQDVGVVQFPIDKSDGFIRHLVALARRVTIDAAPNIAICSYKGLYESEFKSLQAEHRRLVEQGEISGGKLLTCDVRDVECDGGEARVRGQPVAVIHNKVDQLMIDPDDPELAGWVRATRSERVEFVNSVAAMYLTEAKRVLVLLSDESWQKELALDQRTISAIHDLIPRSWLVACSGGAYDQPSVDGPSLVNVFSDRHRYVLKADSSTRGAGIYIGSQFSAEDWTKAFAETAQVHGIIQECAATPQRPALGGEMGEQTSFEFWGVDLFYLGADFAGPVSRSHTQMVFNVGNGGRESPVLVIP